MRFACGHLYKANVDWDSLTYYGKIDFIKWKYSVGTNGTRTKCFDCWLKSGKR